jgi:hypothetical protein
MQATSTNATGRFSLRLIMMISIIFFRYHGKLLWLIVANASVSYVVDEIFILGPSLCSNK